MGSVVYSVILSIHICGEIRFISCPASDVSGQVMDYEQTKVERIDWHLQTTVYPKEMENYERLSCHIRVKYFVNDDGQGVVITPCTMRSANFSKENFP